MKINRTLLFGLVWLTALAMVTACGKKGPPLPPLKEGLNLAPPIDLTFQLTGTRVFIQWNHKTDPDKARVRPEAFEVSAAVKGPGDCEGCPFVFKSMATIPMPDMKYELTLDPVSRYYFRVQALGPDGMRSKYTQTILVDPSGTGQNSSD
ncbi:hypothetical protein [Desulfospira joergensenii]|uniref:hypothetical protein n=1 Tax=Desulfospira joergensenii TaxID=53329 RepID=UPI0003B42F99|nr:hypothetical protein [Desulfospira joergensenii]